MKQGIYKSRFSSFTLSRLPSTACPSLCLSLAHSTFTSRYRLSQHAVVVGSFSVSSSAPLIYIFFGNECEAVTRQFMFLIRFALFIYCFFVGR